MIKLWSAILFGMIISTSIFAGEVRTEYIIEETCTAISGCWLNPLTGECPDCVTVTRKVVTEIKDSDIIARVEPKKIKKKKRTSKKKNWVGTLFKCQVGCVYPYWDSAGNNYMEHPNRGG